jgi:hypothetical protein
MLEIRLGLILKGGDESVAIMQSVVRDLRFTPYISLDLGANLNRSISVPEPPHVAFGQRRSMEALVFTPTKVRRTLCRLWELSKWSVSMPIIP